MRASRALIHTAHLKHNLQLVKRHIGKDVKLCPAIKADAYGHGIVEVARIFREEGVDALGVATVDEAVGLREEGIDLPILLLSLPLPEEISAIVDYDLRPVVAEKGLITRISEEAEKRNKVALLHLKVDTGMGRIGCKEEEAAGLAQIISSNPNLKLDGITTHFPVADAEDGGFTARQIVRFNQILEGIKKAGISLPMVHSSNSGGILGYPEAHYQMVRPGIILYGYHPSKEAPLQIDILPVMKLTSRIVYLKTVEAGTGISYGLTYRTQNRTTIATIPIGYGDGYFRMLSNKAEVLIKGKRYPVVGRVCMDQIMVDLGKNSNVKLYDEVTLFGPDPAGPNARELADLCATIPYEITCNISKRVPRIYID